MASMQHRGREDHFLFIGSALIAIALGSTVCALSLQGYFGRSALTIAARPALALLGTAVFSLLIQRDG